MGSRQENSFGVTLTKTISEEHLQSLVQRVEDRERVARRRAAIYSLIPIILAGLLLWFTAWQIQQANQELATIGVKLQSSQQELASVNEQLAQAREQVNRSQQELTAVNEQLAQAREQLNRSQQELAAANEKLKQAQQEVATLKEQVERYREDAAELQARVDKLNKALDNITEELRQATNFQKYAFPGDVALALKYLDSAYPQQGRLLADILEMQYAGVGWKLGGLSPEEGFDSPSFAAYVLERHDLLTVPASSARYRLREVLPARDQPQVGDAVFYQLGYTMFYFVDEGKRPFVVGMTPLGILALRADFAPVLGYGEVKYR